MDKGVDLFGAMNRQQALGNPSNLSVQCICSTRKELIKYVVENNTWWGLTGPEVPFVVSRDRPRAMEPTAKILAA